MEIFTPPNIKPKAPPGRRPKHSVEYRMMVARKVVKEGMSFREASSAFGLSHGSISAIVKQYKAQGDKSKRNERVSKYKDEVETYRQQSQLKDLKLEIADLYLENLMLKKALEHSLQKKKDDSSVITSENLDRLKEAEKWGSRERAFTINQQDRKNFKSVTWLCAKLLRKSILSFQGMVIAESGSTF